MGGCESVPEEEVYEYPRRRYRPRTPVVYSRAPRVVPITTVRKQPRMVPTVMGMPDRHFPMQMPAVEGPRYAFNDYYDDGYMDRGRGLHYR